MTHKNAAPAEAATETVNPSIPQSADDSYDHGCWYACQGAHMLNKRKGWHPGRWVRHYLPGSRLEHLERMCDVAIQQHRARGCLIAELGRVPVGGEGQ